LIFYTTLYPSFNQAAVIASSNLFAHAASTVIGASTANVRIVAGADVALIPGISAHFYVSSFATKRVS
jgi:hypothetical protein